MKCLFLRSLFYFVTGCKQCQRVRSLKHKIDIPQSHFLFLDIPVELVCFETGTDKGSIRKRKQQRNAFLVELGKCVSALRNSKGGAVIIHMNGFDSHDNFLDYFHELVDNKLRDLIEDGSLFVDTYKKTWLKLTDFKTAGFISVIVKPSHKIVTVDFKTKVTCDNFIEDPSALALEHFLKTQQRELDCRKEERIFKKEVTGDIVSDTERFAESRSVQSKSFLFTKHKDKDLLKDIDEFVNYIFYDLKLRQYISAFSKVQGGGSFYLGVSERQKTYTGYKSKEYVADGFEINELKRREFERKLLEKVKSEISVYDLKLIEDETPTKVADPDILKVVFHSVNSEQTLVVLELIVSQVVQGIVFYEKEGPESYKVDETGDAVRLTFKEWCQRFLQSKIRPCTCNLQE